MEKKESIDISKNRISLFTGHFGSGKSEIAVNYAFELKKNHDNVTLLDFDIVNPFFRSADAAEELNKMGIKTVLPMFANTNVDTPVLTGEVMAAFDDNNTQAVFDVGGDDLGARAVATYKNDIVANGYEMFFVFNTFRPMTDSVEKMTEMFHEVCGSAGIKATALVNNTNILEQTDGQIIYEGQKMIMQVSQTLGVPIKMVCGTEGALNDFREVFLKEEGRECNCQFLCMDRRIHLPWDRE